MKKALILAGILLCQGELQPYVTWPSGRLVDNGHGGVDWVKPDSEIIWLQPLEENRNEFRIPSFNRDSDDDDDGGGLYDNPLFDE